MSNLVLLDGAVGTSIWEKTEDKLPVWTYNITKPEIVKELNDEYVAAGSKIILANTFGANRLAVQRSSTYTVDEVVSAAMQIAKKAVEGTEVKVALSAGPLTQLMEPYGDLTEEEVDEIYSEMFDAGMKYHADVIMLQTFIDLGMMKVAATAAKRYGVPVYCTLSFEPTGKTMFGNSVQDVIDELTEVGVDGVGLNCSLGPDKAVPIIKQFREKTNLKVLFKPNAGKPIMASDGTTGHPYTKEDFAREVESAVPYVDFLGGCCGTNPGYISYLKAYFIEKGLI